MTLFASRFPRFHRFPRATPLTLAMIVLVGLSATLALPGHAGSAGQTDSSQTDTVDGLSCEVVKSDRGGMVEIAAYVKADQTTLGTYAMKIRGPGGGTMIRQAGDFETLSGERTELSQAMLSGRAEAFDVRLRVSSDGQTLDCSSI